MTEAALAGAHIDTVPVENAGSWKHPPHNGDIVDSRRLYLPSGGVGAQGQLLVDGHGDGPGGGAAGRGPHPGRLLLDAGGEDTVVEHRPQPGEFDPRSYLKPAKEAMRKVCVQRFEELIEDAAPLFSLTAAGKNDG